MQPTRNIVSETRIRRRPAHVSLLLLCAFLFIVGAPFAACVHAAGTDGMIPIAVRAKGKDAKAALEADLSIAFPGNNDVEIVPSSGVWTDLEAMQFQVFWPENAPSNSQVLVYVKDRDDLWYQALLPGYLSPGEWNDCSIDLGPDNGAWTGHGHYAAWHFRALTDPKQFGIRVFGKGSYKGSCNLRRLLGKPRRDTSAPFIRGVRANSKEVKCFEKFELTFECSDRYVDPFDGNQVAVSADFKTPDGKTITVDGFYSRDFYRKNSSTGEKIMPQGPPFWRVRFSPTKPGTYKYSLRISDKHGKSEWGPETFVATKAELPGFVRVSKHDSRYFEFDDGSFYFPVGHNLRSPNDGRTEKNFPWKHRWLEGASSYVRRFADMRAHGENFSEIWSAAWSFGLEWNKTWKGYRGVGQYNMMNAWDLDRTLEEAEKQGIYLILVIHNHGKFSSWCDEEWSTNPFNVTNGGYLTKPEEYFTNPKAMAAFRKLMRYIVSRWGYSTHIFSWQLWSELDLTGSSGENKYYKQPEVLDWHRIMGQSVKELDPYDHLVSTHVCWDYTYQIPDLCKLPELDYCGVDAYHNESRALHIVDLIQKTVEFNNPFGKPVLITEFGGTPFAQGLKHLDDTFHAALWASTCSPVGGTPMFWWWHLIEEEQFYPRFTAIKRFMKGEERRDPEFVHRAAHLSAEGEEASKVALKCMGNKSKAVGWIYRTSDFHSVDPKGDPVTTGLNLTVSDLTEGMYEVEFWDTSAGMAVNGTTAKTTEGRITVELPAFPRDMAFKVRLTTPRR